LNKNDQGLLLAIGGGEDRKREKLILKKFVYLAGGSLAKIMIVPVASGNGEVLGQEYSEIFKSLGSLQTEVVNITSRKEALHSRWERKLPKVTGVFFTGGDQLKLTSILGGTVFERELKKMFARGMILAGTSAGAAAMSGTMIVEGLSDKPPLQCTVKMAPGLGFLQEVVIDQHFAQRGRVGRLLAAVAQNPFVIGLGLDEDTAVLVNGTGVLKVIGSQTAVVIDGHDSISSNVTETYGHDPLAIIGVTFHVLPSGHGFQLKKRKYLGPTSREVEAVEFS